MGKLVVISGPSGAGKGTVVKELLNIYKEKNEKVYLSVSATTRLKREGEVDGINYYFLKEEEFLEKIKENDFLEYNMYATGKYYGTLKSNVLKHLDLGYDVILEIDINGYKQVISNYPEAIGIFIMPPSLEILEKRLRDRGTETEENIKKRLSVARSEIKNKEIYSNIVINYDNKIDLAAKEVYEIIKND